MAGVSVTGNKKIATLQKEFNEQFPYIKIIFFNGNTPVSGSLTLAQARTKSCSGSGDISINGNKKVLSLEKELASNYGLTVKICWTSKNDYNFKSGCATENFTLSKLNDFCKKTGDKKGVWKLTSKAIL